VQIPVGLCGTAPSAGCKTPLAPGTSQLQMKNRAIDTQDRLAWKWNRGRATSLADFGDPATSTTYDLCVYAGNTLVSRTTAPAAGTCRGGRPCWRSTSTGWTYSQSAPGDRGLQKVTLRSGGDGKAKVQAKGKGGLLSLPALPLVGTPIRAQLVNGDGKCWEATYSNPSRNDSDRFKAKSD
jgi:hypothetical protein